MKDERVIRVRHRKYGRGYVYLICEDYLGVAFLFGLKRVSFQLSAMQDGTLIVTDTARERFRHRYETFMEWVHEEKEKYRDAEQED